MLFRSTVDTLAIRAHTRFLADDMLAGRGTGTQGERLAAAYISGVVTRPARTIIILNARKLLSSTERLALSAMESA